MTTKSELNMAAVIQNLLDNDFVPDGLTKEEIVRIPTKNSPLFGTTGGELAKFGGRQRYHKPGTDIKSTVGLRTVAFYRVQGSGLQGVKGIATHDTKDLISIQTTLAKLE